MSGIVEADVRRLWESGIAPQLGLAGQYEIHRATGGVTSMGFRVHSADSSWFLRVVPVADRRRLKKYIRNGTILRRLGFSTPVPVGHGCWENWCWVAEGLVPGTPLVNRVGNASGIERVVETLVRLHTHQRRWAGDRFHWGPWNLPRVWVRDYPRSWRRLAGVFPELERVHSEVFDWVKQLPSQFRPTRYQLLHGDFHSGNLIETPTGELVLLDYSTPRYGIGYLEALWFAHNHFGDDDELQRAFLERYLSTISPAVDAEVTRAGPILHAWFHLRQADRNADLAMGRGGRGSAEQREHWKRVAWDMWLRYCDLAGITSPLSDAVGESPFPLRVHPYT